MPIFFSVIVFFLLASHFALRYWRPTMFSNDLGEMLIGN